MCNLSKWGGDSLLIAGCHEGIRYSFVLVGFFEIFKGFFLMCLDWKTWNTWSEIEFSAAPHSDADDAGKEKVGRFISAPYKKIIYSLFGPLIATSVATLFIKSRRSESFLILIHLNEKKYKPVGCKWSHLIGNAVEQNWKEKNHGW